MSEQLPSNPLDTLLQRLKEDGGRYLLSVALTAGEHAAQEPAAFGGKSWKRWLTDTEYKELCALLECEKFARPLSCETHGLVPNLALFDNKCPACELDTLRALVKAAHIHEVGGCPECSADETDVQRGGNK